MAIEAIPLNDTHDFYNVSETFEVYNRESALILDHLFAHLAVLETLGQRFLRHPVLRARLRELYMFDMADDTQHRALIKVLSQEVGQLALAYAQSLQLDRPETDEERRQLLRSIQAQIPNLHGDLEASNADIRRAQARWEQQFEESQQRGPASH